MHPYEVIFFDLDHTLIDTRRQYDLGLRQTLAEMYGESLPVGYQERFMAHHEALWALYDARHISIDELRRERFVRAWRDFGVEKSLEEADAFQARYDQTFESTLFPFPGTHSLLAELAENHRLGIITNGSPDLQWRKVQICGLDLYFRPETVIISANVGAAKPHPSVYHAACQALTVSPDNALMIGDNYKADVQGARDAGIEALWYSPDPEVTAAQSGCTPEETPIADAQALLAAIQRREESRT
jgi:HAD superfamily hydrolase (TIGR01549 family)